MKRSLLVSLATTTRYYGWVAAFSTTSTRQYRSSTRHLAPPHFLPSRGSSAGRDATFAGPFGGSGAVRSRLFFSRSNNEKNGSSILSGLQNKAKQWLPFLKSDQEKERDALVRQQRDEMQEGIQSMLRDAPLPVRLMGGLVGRMAAGVASELASQQQDVDAAYRDAVRDLRASRAVQELLNADNNLQIGTPYSSSSSSSSVNGQTTTTIQLEFTVQSASQRGVARLSVQTGGGGGLSQRQLVVQAANGRQVNVLSASSSSNSSGPRFRNSQDDNDNVIEAEIVTKKKN